MIAYRIENGVCVEVRFVPDGYVHAANELTMSADYLPTQESLSDPKAWAAYIAPKPTSISDGQLAAILVSKGLISQQDIATALASVTDVLTPTA